MSSSMPESLSESLSESKSMVSEGRHVFGHLIILSGIVLVILGVFGYLLYRFLKNKNSKQNQGSNSCSPECKSDDCMIEDGCGGMCSCKDSNQTCFKNKCCTRLCAGKQCGDSDSCGGTCSSGPCNDPSQTCYQGKCCSQDCQGKRCGDSDGCGGLCSNQTCADPQVCYQGVCGPPFHGATRYQLNKSSPNILNLNTYMASGDFLALSVSSIINWFGLLNGKIILLNASKSPVSSKLNNCFYVFLQPDGELTVFDEDFNQIWSSGTRNQGVDSLVLEYVNNGFLSLMKGGVQVKPLIIGTDI